MTGGGRPPRPEAVAAAARLYRPPGPGEGLASVLPAALVALGLVIGFARREPEAAAALAARRRNRSAGLSAATHSDPPR